MGISEYVVQRDKFEPDDRGFGLVFPCCACRHRSSDVQEEPCRTCDHNAGAAADPE